LLDEKLLDPELLKQLKEGKLSAEDLKKIAEALKGCKECLAGSLEKLQKARLIDAEMLKKLAEAGKCYCPAKDGDPALCLAEILARGKTNSDRGGKGGVTEGPGHNPITWTDGTNEDNLKFKEIVLPPSDLKQSRILGIGKVDPKTGEVTASKAGALNKDNAGGGGANTGVVLPQHRSTIERFFLRSQKKE